MEDGELRGVCGMRVGVGCGGVELRVYLTPPPAPVTAA